MNAEVETAKRRLKDEKIDNANLLLVKSNAA
jgi:hypothetical protein